MKKRKMIISVLIILVLIVIKMVWVYAYTKDNGTFEGEKKDIQERKNYLVFSHFRPETSIPKN